MTNNLSHAESQARRTAAAAVLADFRRELATAPLSKPPGREWMFRLADALESVLEASPAPEAEDLEPYCTVCGGAAGIFQDTAGPGGWRHYRGDGTPGSPVVLYDAGHAPVIGWRPAGGAR